MDAITFTSAPCRVQARAVDRPRLRRAAPTMSPSSVHGGAVWAVHLDQCVRGAARGASGGVLLRYGCPHWRAAPADRGNRITRQAAAGAGLRQSHLTYYYPTRLDLLEAVGRTAIERQLAAVDATLDGHASLDAAADGIAAVVVRDENTRVFMALSQAGDEEPRLRELFRELADGIVARVARFLGGFGVSAVSEEPARLLHALSVGLAVVDVATGRSDSTQRAAGVLQAALSMIAGNDARRAAPAPTEGKAR